MDITMEDDRGNLHTFDIPDDAVITKNTGVDTYKYGVVHWIGNNPVLDGMPFFETMKDATDFATKQENLVKGLCLESRFTIIRLVPCGDA